MTALLVYCEKTGMHEMIIVDNLFLFLVHLLILHILFVFLDNFLYNYAVLPCPCEYLLFVQGEGCNKVRELVARPLCHLFC